MLNYVINFTFDPRAGPSHLLWTGRVWLHVAVNSSTSENLPLSIMNHFGYLKGANEVNRQYFQQAVLLCLLRALYYAGICSYAACIILCPKLCWHNLPRPIQRCTHYTAIDGRNEEWASVWADVMMVLWSNCALMWCHMTCMVSLWCHSI